MHAKFGPQEKHILIEYSNQKKILKKGRVAQINYKELRIK